MARFHWWNLLKILLHQFHHLILIHTTLRSVSLFTPLSPHKTYGSCACLRTSLSLHTPTKTKAINAPSITSTLKMGMPMPYINDQFINSMRRLPWENKQENYQHQCNSKSKSIFTSIQDHFLPYQTIFILMHFILSQARQNIKYSIN